MEYILAYEFNGRNSISCSLTKTAFPLLSTCSQGIHHCSGAYVKNIAFDKSTGEIIGGGGELILDTEKIGEGKIQRLLLHFHK